MDLMTNPVKNCARYENKIVLAPMVRIGSLPFRLLSLRYGADLVYSEEIIDYKLLGTERRVNDMLGTIDYIDGSEILVFRTCPEEKSKLVLQIGTSDAERALKVGKKLENDISSIDINMGCPKDFSIKGGMGAALLSQPDKIKAILTNLTANLKIPVTCKIRVLSTLEETIKLAQMIETCGVSALAIHGRNIDERQQHENRNHFIKEVAAKLKIPVIANGGSKEMNEYSDIEKFRESAGSSSVMLARAAEWNCSIFNPEPGAGKESKEEIIKKFLKLAIEFDNPYKITKYTVQNILKEDCEYSKGRVFMEAKTPDEIYELYGLTEYYQNFLQKCEDFRIKKMVEESESEFALKRPLTSLTSQENENIENSNKKSKLDENIVIVPNCVFVRAQFKKDTELPKTVLNKYVSTSKLEKKDYPSFKTEQNGKRFKSTVVFQGVAYSTDCFEKSKKFAEQASAMACLKALGIPNF